MNDQTKAPTLAQLARTGADLKYRCPYPKCKKAFDTPQGRSMHVVRVHTHRFGSRNRVSEEERKERKRQYNRYYAKMKRKKAGVKPRFTPFVLHRDTPDQVTESAIKYCPHCGHNLEKYL
jgi:hypothetical protein